MVKKRRIYLRGVSVIDVGRAVSWKSHTKIELDENATKSVVLVMDDMELISLAEAIQKIARMRLNDAQGFVEAVCPRGE